LGACSLVSQQPASDSAAHSNATAPAAGGPEKVTPEERAWARQALIVLQTVDAGVDDYHRSTEFPVGSAQRRQLSQSAYARFSQAVGEHEALLPNTESIKDAPVRDQYMFAMGNIGGFLTPTGDLLGDPPTMGDRIARSLENAIAASAAVRPRLERISGPA
jgi:hypothetical protein